MKTAIAALVGSAPAALDTLEELARALAGDANLKATLLAEIGKKLMPLILMPYMIYLLVSLFLIRSLPSQQVA